MSNDSNVKKTKQAISALEEQMAILRVKMSTTNNKTAYTGYENTLESIQKQHQLYTEVLNNKYVSPDVIDLPEAYKSNNNSVNAQALRMLAQEDNLFAGTCFWCNQFGHNTEDCGKAVKLEK